jgi:hypothetical protein
MEPIESRRELLHQRDSCVVPQSVGAFVGQRIVQFASVH